MSQVTTNIRIYGADCNQSSLVLAAIQATKVNMTVWLGNYPSLTDNGTAYERQKGEIQTALQQFGSANVGGVTVGNEIILEWVSVSCYPSSHVSCPPVLSLPLDQITLTVPLETLVGFSLSLVRPLLHTSS